MPRAPREIYAVLHKAALTLVPKREPGITLRQFIDGMVSRLPRLKGREARA